VLVESGGVNWFDGSDAAVQLLRALIYFDSGSGHDGCRMLVIYDNASGHGAFAEDALRVADMALKPSKKTNVLMRDTVWFDNAGECHAQKMVRGGKNIGVFQCLMERNLWPRTARLPTLTAKQNKRIGRTERFLLKCRGGNKCMIGRNDCCASKLLGSQPDFQGQKCRLEEVVDNYNRDHGTQHMILFLPKFHPELNPIERYWAALKGYLRLNTAWTTEGLRELLPLALTKGVPSESFGRYFRACFRIMTAYRLGCSHALASFASRQFASHRSIPTKETLESIGRELAEKQGTKFIPIKSVWETLPDDLAAYDAAVSLEKERSQQTKNAKKKPKTKKRKAPPSGQRGKNQKKKRKLQHNSSDDDSSFSSSSSSSEQSTSEDEPEGLSFMTWQELHGLTKAELKEVAQQFLSPARLECFDIAWTNAVMSAFLSEEEIPRAGCLEITARNARKRKAEKARSARSTIAKSQTPAQSSDSASSSRNHVENQSRKDIFEDLCAKHPQQSESDLWDKAIVMAATEGTRSSRRKRTSRVIVDGASVFLPSRND
jgi:hypothetical protein